jgi:hypothetical protein
MKNPRYANGGDFLLSAAPSKVAEQQVLRRRPACLLHSVAHGRMINFTD